MTHGFQYSSSDIPLCHRSSYLVLSCSGVKQVRVCYPDQFLDAPLSTTNLALLNASKLG